MGGMEPLYRNDFKYKVLDVRDVASENIGGHFSSTVKWMTDVINRGGTIFCHCNAGISRSPTICVAYLMYDHAMGLDSAILLTRKAHPVAYPNPGFKGQL